jgi:hypothetical protein
MGFVSLVVALSVSQVDELRTPVSIALTSRRPNAETAASRIAARLFELLKREGIADVRDDARTVKELKAAGFSDPRSCNGGQTCSGRLAVLLGPKAVLVAVDVGKVSRSLAIHLEAFAADLSEPLLAIDIEVREDKWADQSLADLTSFARQLKDKLAVAAPIAVVTPPPDSPRETKLEPAPIAAPRTDVTETVEPPSKVPAIAVASAAGIALAVAGVFAGLAAADRTTWDRNVVAQPDGSLGSTTLTQAQVTQLANGLNTKASVAAGSGLAGAALAGVAVFLFLR